MVSACVCGLEILALTERQEVAEKTGLGKYPRMKVLGQTLRNTD